MKSPRTNARQRGYTTEHDNLRAKWAPIVATGQVTCWRCGHTITPGSPWDLGHNDHDRSQYRGPEHVACNRATKSHQGSRKRPPQPHPGISPE